MWLYASIINTELVSYVYSFSLKYFYKNNDKLINNNNCIKIKMLDKLNKIKWSYLSTLAINTHNELSCNNSKLENL